jgi:hypothetical protein
MSSPKLRRQRRDEKEQSTVLHYSIVHDEEASESQIRPKRRPSFRKVRQSRRYSPFRADLTPDGQADAVGASVTHNNGRDCEHSNERLPSHPSATTTSLLSNTKDTPRDAVSP